MNIIGKYSSLEVIKQVDFGYYLDGGPYGEILLPTRETLEKVVPGQETQVFIYCDSEDRLIATHRNPKAAVEEFAYLRVVAVGEYGAFLDWGLQKDLFVPFREQHERMEEGRSYVVRVILDTATDRIMASSRLNRFLKNTNEDLEEKQSVELMIVREMENGYKVMVNNEYWGVVYYNEIFRPVEIGDEMKGFVKRIREDQLIDISLQQQGAVQISSDAVLLLDKLKQENGYLPLTDKSPPNEIYSYMEMSKKAFKRAVGSLYKERLISLEDEGIRLVETKEET